MIVLQVICVLIVFAVVGWLLYDNLRIAKRAAEAAKEYKKQYEMFSERYQAFRETIDRQLDIVSELSSRNEALKKERDEYACKYGNAKSQIAKMKKHT